MASKHNVGDITEMIILNTKAKLISIGGACLLFVLCVFGSMRRQDVTSHQRFLPGQQAINY